MVLQVAAWEGCIRPRTDIRTKKKARSDRVVGTRLCVGVRSSTRKT